MDNFFASDFMYLTSEDKTYFFFIVMYMFEGSNILNKIERWLNINLEILK